MRGLAILCGLLVALSLLLPPAAALDAKTASSIGRLNYAGFKEQQHCTAFLVAPQVAMTAAHCLDGLEPDQVHLLLGYDRGGWQEHLRADGFWRSPDGKDLAALCLTQPAQAVPLAVTAGEVASGEELAVLGYGLPSVHLLSRRDCLVEADSPRDGVLLNCPVSAGTSGGPAFSRTSEEVVAVVSATTEEQSIAVSVPWLLDVNALCPGP